MIAIDTNIVVRYLTGDRPEQSQRAREIVDGQPVFVPVTVVLETERVLRSAYGCKPSDVALALRAFGGLPQVTIEDTAIVVAAFDLVERGMDFADALHLARSAGQEAFLTFDRRFVKAAQAAGIDLVQEA
ncbi:type II toxin-antitoxin system VapC family toxin [Paracoccus aminovorans]|uniref:type II toxin-antitoxin system VapC family toxin n=1 Tax=Paracoccus aminovorans TaxID=34004 RepID=UPI002B25A4FC|nr:type II toxin-antitoxin system VapC family toxin [Paracoccus aminovorans]